MHAVPISYVHDSSDITDRYCRVPTLVMSEAVRVLVRAWCGRGPAWPTPCASGCELRCSVRSSLCSYKLQNEIKPRARLLQRAGQAARAPRSLKEKLRAENGRAMIDTVLLSHGAWMQDRRAPIIQSAMRQSSSHDLR